MTANGARRLTRQRGITRLTVKGFKSIHDRAEVELRPLTIFAGANSSGKSSVVQPLLMMKQTLEAVFDPGALLLNGPNVAFTRMEQFLCKLDKSKTRCMEIGVEIDERSYVESLFVYANSRRGIELEESRYTEDEMLVKLNTSMSSEEIKEQIPNLSEGESGPFSLIRVFVRSNSKEIELGVKQNRCFLDVDLLYSGNKKHSMGIGSVLFRAHERYISEIIHVPAFRGNPARTYQLTPVTDSHFHGTFENYVASIVNKWQSTKNKRLSTLGDALAELGLTWKVSSKRIDDTQVELRVGRLRRPTQGGAHDLVGIADVGFGVSQVLPVLVALLVAERGQLVYIEQPEIHLHPKAQVALATVLADAAKRGVRVVAETHSALLLLGIQTLVAEGKLDKDLVKLHWFSLQEDGTSKVSSHDLDATGAYGEWPEDFGDVELKAQSDYLDAVESQELVK